MSKIGVLGTGMVGQAIASRLVGKGYEVSMGSRSAENEKAVAFAEKYGDRADNGTFADAARFADEIVFNCTNGHASITALELAGAGNLKGKIIIDVANPLDFTHGMPPKLLFCNEDSLGEQIQHHFPDSKVIKSLNTMNCEIMLHPESISGDHNVFVCGNDADARMKVAGLLEEFGWKAENIIDLGDITAARGTEMLLPLWLRLFSKIGTVEFNFNIVRKT